MIKAVEAKATRNIFVERSMIGFKTFLANWNRENELSDAISKRAKEGYSSHSFQVPRCYRAAIEPYFEDLGYKTIVTPNIKDNSLVDVDIFW